MPCLCVTAEVILATKDNFAMATSPIYAVNEDDTRECVEWTAERLECGKLASVMPALEAAAKETIIGGRLRERELCSLHCAGIDRVSFSVLAKIRLACEGGGAMSALPAPTAWCAFNA